MAEAYALRGVRSYLVLAAVLAFGALAGSCELFVLLQSHEEQIAGDYVATFVSPTNSSREIRLELDLLDGEYDEQELERAAGTTNDWTETGPLVSGSYSVDLDVGLISLTPEGSDTEQTGEIVFDSPLLILRFDTNDDGDYQDERETTVYYDTTGG